MKAHASGSATTGSSMAQVPRAEAGQPRSGRPWLIGMVHIGALPGTPMAEHSLPRIARQAADEAAVLVDAGFDAILIENMHDRPYLRRDAVGPEIVAGMTRAGLAIRSAIGDAVPLGVQILAGANQAALATALALAPLQCDEHEPGRAVPDRTDDSRGEARFIRPLTDLAPHGVFARVEGFVFSSIADEGLFEDADAGDLLRYRRAVGAAGTPGQHDRLHIPIFADIKKKHSSHAITQDVSLAETARAADFFEADGLIVTGVATGQPAAPADVAEVREATLRPVLVGSGVKPERAEVLARAGADGLIVGSWYKFNGDWTQPPDPKRAADLVAAIRGIRVAAH